MGRSGLASFLEARRVPSLPAGSPTYSELYEVRVRLLTVLLFGVFLVATQVFLVLKAMQDNLFDRNVDPVDAVMERQESVSDDLTPQERLWLSKNHTVRVGIDPDFYPLEKFDAEGRYTGIGPDYLRILHKMTGLTFRITPPSDWSDTTDMATSHKVDMYIAAAETQHRSQYMLFTPSYIVLPGIIVARQPTKDGLMARSPSTGETEPDIEGIKDLAGKQVAVVNRYSWHDFLEELHPEIVPVPVKNTLEGLQKVAFGEVDAMIDYQFNITEKNQQQRHPQPPRRRPHRRALRTCLRHPQGLARTPQHHQQGAR